MSLHVIQGGDIKVLSGERGQQFHGWSRERTHPYNRLWVGPRGSGSRVMGAQRGPPGADLSGGPRVGSRHGNLGRPGWCPAGWQRAVHGIGQGRCGGRFGVGWRPGSCGADLKHTQLCGGGCFGSRVGGASRGCSSWLCSDGSWGTTGSKVHDDSLG